MSKGAPIFLSSNPQLDLWHKIVFNRDQYDLLARLAEYVVFNCPYVELPSSGREAAWRMLTTFSEVLQDFTYHRELIVGNNWVLEFSTRAGNRPLEGIDLIRLDEDNRIAEYDYLSCGLLTA